MTSQGQRRGVVDRLSEGARQTYVARMPRSALGGSATFLVADHVFGLGTGAAAAFGSLGALSLFAVLSVSTRLERNIRNSQDAVTLAAFLGRHTPSFGTWAIDADLAQLITEDVTQRSPSVIVECGSGASTLVAAASLARQGHGRLYSIEHDPNHARNVEAVLEAAGYHEYVDLIVAPLVETTFRSRRTSWYDPAIVTSRVPESVDLLIVDGPPSVDRWSRWPAGEVFHRKLVGGAQVLLDDGRRRRERKAAFSWRATYQDLELYWHDTVKGTWRLSKTLEVRQESPGFRFALLIARTFHPRPSGLGKWPVRR